MVNHASLRDGAYYGLHDPPGCQQLAASLAGATELRFLRFLVDMTGGRLFGEFEALGREQLPAWFQVRRIHCDWVARVDLEATAEGVRDL